MKLKKIKKPKLTIITMADIRSFGPCYDPIKYIPESWKGTAIDILKMKNVPSRDKVWVVCREKFLDAGLIRCFAVAQAKTCRKQIKAGNKKEFDRILRVCLRFVNGKATQDELYAARAAAESSAEFAAESAAWSAARAAVWSVAVKMLLKMVREYYAK
jgi:hypothetical protein